MTTTSNQLGQPVGDVVAGWSARARPARQPLAGRWCRYSLIDAEWPAHGVAYEQRLSPLNFVDGRQIRSLGKVRRSLDVAVRSRA